MLPFHATFLTFTLYVLFHIVTFVNARIFVIDQYGQTVDDFVFAPAPFGRSFLDPVNGLTVLASPEDACEDIALPHVFHNKTVLTFVLINGSSGDDCSFVKKAKNAERANFDLAIIYSYDVHPEPRFEMVHIPVVLINSGDGIKVKYNYLYHNGTKEIYFLRIIPLSNDISYYITLFSVVIGVCLVVMVFFMLCLLVKCIQERRRSRRNRLSSWQIRQIPTEIFKKGDQYDVCAICLEEYKEGDKLRILPCSHAYHSRCIDPWLTDNRRNCPLCKRKVRLGDSSSSSDSDSELTSPAEDTPLINSAPERSQSWGTFGQGASNSNSGADQLRTVVRSASASSHYSAASAAANNSYSDFEKSAAMASAEGSINSGGGGDVENSIEYYSCNGAQDHHSTVENTHGLVV